MSYSEDFKIFVSTIYGEAANCSEKSWKVIAHTIRNRIGFANWKSWSNVLQIVVNTGYDAYTHKNAPYKTAKKALDTGNISSRLKSLIDAVEPIFNGTEPDFTGGVVYYYSPKAQAELHRTNPSRYPSLVPPFVTSTSNPTYQAHIPGTEKDDMRWYKVITSKLDISFVDTSGNPLTEAKVDVVYNDRKPVPLFRNLSLDSKGRMKQLKVCNYMGARFKIDGVLAKDKNNKEISLLGDGNNYSLVIVVNNGKAGLSSKTEIHNQQPPQKIEETRQTTISSEESNNSENSSNKVNVNFDLRVLDSDGNPIPKISYFLKYKGNEKKHSTENDGIERNIQAETGEVVTVLVSGKDSKQEVGGFTVLSDNKTYDINFKLHKFEILFRHKNNSRAIKNLNLVQIYRGKKYSKKTNDEGKIIVNAMPGFDLNYKLRNGKNLLSIKVDKNKNLRVIDVDSQAIEQANKDLELINSEKKSLDNKDPVQVQKQENNDETPKRDQTQTTSQDGHPKIIVNDNNQEVEFSVLTYDKKTNQLFSGGNYLIEYKGNKRDHSSGTHGLGKKVHKAIVGQNIKVVTLESGRETVHFNDVIKNGMKDIDLKIAKPSIPTGVEGISVGFNGVAEKWRQDIVSQKTKNVLAYLAKEAGMRRILITSTIRTPESQANAMYSTTISYAAAGEAVKRVRDECKNKGLSKDATLKKMVEKILELQSKGQRVSLHCVSQEQYKKMNVVDIGLNSNGFGSNTNLSALGKKFKQVCIKAKSEGKISGFIPGDAKGEGAMHIKIIQ